MKKQNIAMVSRKSHAEKSICPIACGLDILGDHWSLLIVRDVLWFNRHEFGEFLESPEGISTNILSQRLKQLQEQAILRFVHHPQDKKRKLYFLTPKGKELAPIILQIGLWANKYLPQTDVSVRAMAAQFGNDSEAFLENVLSAQTQWEQQHLPPELLAQK